MRLQFAVCQRTANKSMSRTEKSSARQTSTTRHIYQAHTAKSMRTANYAQSARQRTAHGKALEKRMAKIARTTNWNDGPTSMAHLMVRPNGRLCRELGSHARQTV
jgi:hypothetical protein